MQHNESAFLASVVEAANSMITSGTERETALLAAEASVLQNLRTFPLDSTTWFDSAVRKSIKTRRYSSSHARKRSLKAYAQAFRAAGKVMAAAEIANRQQMKSCVVAMEDLNGSAVGLLGVRDLFGGRLLKCLLLTSLHARAVVLTEEVMHLLEFGFCEAAEARARTLYEATVIIWLLSFAGHDGEDNFELCERYYVSSLLERRRTTYDRSDRRLASAARRQWGPEFFRPYGWARPLVAEPRGKITFSDLERCVESDEFRPWYLRFNNAVHSGALNTVSRSDFRRAWPNSTRAEYEPWNVRDISRVALPLLELSTYASTKAIAAAVDRWDDMLLLAHFRNFVEAAVDSFAHDSPVVMGRGAHVE